MKKLHNLKQKIIFYVMSVSILLAVLIITIMSIGNIRSTNSVLLDNMQITTRIASQSISSNLHLLTERMHDLALEDVFTDSTSDTESRQARLDEAKLYIEFVWLSAYDASGQKLYGDTNAPESIADTGYYADLTQTGNIVMEKNASFVAERAKLGKVASCDRPTYTNLDVLKKRIKLLGEK